MFPFQQIDLSKLSYAAVLDIIAPILPGGTIALGWLYGHPEVWGNLHDERTLKIVVAGFAIYVLGFVVLYLSTFELGAVALAVLIRSTTVYEPWKNAEWRRVASAFLGSELSPPVEEPPVEALESALPVTNAESLSKAIKENFTKRMAPHNFQLRWQKWYEVLRVYFPAPQNPQLAFGNFYFSVLNSIGLAGLVSACICHWHVGWLVWLTCILIIAVANVSFTTSFSQQQHPDSSGDQLAAAILKAIKDRDLAAELSDKKADG
jgi:hypothetical protein